MLNVKDNYMNYTTDHDFIESEADILFFIKFHLETSGS